MSRIVAVRYGAGLYTPAVLSSREFVEALRNLGLSIKYGGEGTVVGEGEPMMRVHLVKLPAGSILCYPKRKIIYRFRTRR